MRELVLEIRSEKWLKPYEAGRDQMWRLSDRDNEIRKGCKVNGIT